MTSNNFAARAGRWSARHRKAAVLGWIAFVLDSLRSRHVVVGTNSASDDNVPGESGRAERILSGAFPDHAHETVLVTSSARTSDPAFRAAVGDVMQRMRGNPRC